MAPLRNNGPQTELVALFSVIITGTRLSLGNFHANLTYSIRIKTLESGLNSHTIPTLKIPSHVEYLKLKNDRKSKYCAFMKKSVNL